MKNLNTNISTVTLFAFCECKTKYQNLDIKHLKLYAEICLKSKQALIYK